MKKLLMAVLIVMAFSIVGCHESDSPLIVRSKHNRFKLSQTDSVLSCEGHVLDIDVTRVNPPLIWVFSKYESWENDSLVESISFPNEDVYYTYPNNKHYVGDWIEFERTDEYRKLHIVVAPNRSGVDRKAELELGYYEDISKITIIQKGTE